MKKRLWGYGLLLGLLVGIGALVWVLSIRRDERLTALAKRFPVMPVDYAWVNEQEVLFTKHAVGNHVPNAPFQFNLSTQRETELIGLAKYQIGPLTDLKVSPDGKWLLWYEQGEDAWMGVCSLPDGGHHQHQEFNPCVWLDNQHWLEFVSAGENPRGDEGEEKPGHANLHSVDAPKPLKTLPMDNPVSHNAFNAVWLSGNRVLMQEDMDDASKLAFSTWQVGEQVTQTTTFLLSLPPKAAGAFEVQISPNGKQVVYLLESSYLLPLRKWIGEMIPPLKVAPVLTWELWVSDLDGKKRHLVGYEERPDHSHVQHYILDQVRWLPDGKRVSFLLKGSLFVLPVN